MIGARLHLVLAQTPISRVPCDFFFKMVHPLFFRLAAFGEPDLLAGAVESYFS